MLCSKGKLQSVHKIMRHFSKPDFKPQLSDRFDVVSVADHLHWMIANGFVSWFICPLLNCCCSKRNSRNETIYWLRWRIAYCSRGVNILTDLTNTSYPDKKLCVGFSLSGSEAEALHQSINLVTLRNNPENCRRIINKKVALIGWPWMKLIIHK